MKRLVLALTTVSLLAAAAGPARAQFAIGPTAAFGTDSDFGIGGRLLAGIPGFQIAQRPVSFQGSFDWFIDVCDECTYLEITPALLVPFAGASSVTPFAGAGLNVRHFSVDLDLPPGSPGVDDSDTDIGLGLLGGIFFPMGSLNGQAEGRFDIGGGEQLVLSFTIFFGSLGLGGGN